MASIDLSDHDLDRLIDRLSDDHLARLAGRLRAHSAPAGESEPLLDEPTAAERCGVKPHVLRDARYRGELSYKRIGKAIRYRWSDIDRWSSNRPIKK